MICEMTFQEFNLSNRRSTVNGEFNKKAKFNEE